MPSTLEDFVDNLEKSPSSVEMNRHFDVFVDAMRDVRQRLENLELAHIQNGAKLATVETKTTDVDARLAGVERDRTALKQRQDTVESKPLVHDQRLDDLEARVRMTEGAIGALGGKIEPATKAEAPPIAPAPAPAKTWFGAQSKEEATPPPMGAPVPA
jgi:chromosome segregation ATPase